MPEGVSIASAFLYDDEGVPVADVRFDDGTSATLAFDTEPARFFGFPPGKNGVIVSPERFQELINETAN